MLPASLDFSQDCDVGVLSSGALLVAVAAATGDDAKVRVQAFLDKRTAKVSTS